MACTLKNIYIIKRHSEGEKNKGLDWRSMVCLGSFFLRLIKLGPTDLELNMDSYPIQHPYLDQDSNPVAINRVSRVLTTRS